MPNWCGNYLSVTHSDATQLQRMQDAYDRNELFQEFMPVAPEENCRAKWGTKWDVGGNGCDCNLVDNQLTMSFETAWAPPIGFYEQLTALGFDVIAYYYEPGMSFCGKWVSGIGDEEYGIDGDSEWVASNIPADIDEHMGISSLMSDWEEEEQ